ncbi:CDP-diacylglycerol--serine O-phosphatidyltransferase [Sporosarcina sp. P33]|uniref:CDP-diacylglycerol--serine O-phosphatidyltransferase n=1 Tax=Sporosarcina sp. P33 TaxID=1930764 RepID=UPI0009BE6FAB|nr:CDP-diacylglycerol--serine O-phosphatidyltransferase [Sporosarcina sp. P33]ARD47141.1 CDP-diacylglycerol--serine O-phosphatidyltransferase [Sporosarcina sp. P33]
MFSFRYFDYTKLKLQLANIITVFNLSLGIIAIMLVLKGHGHMSLMFIFFAALFDRFDGMVARHYDAESAFGKELDSLSDLISFGAAPAILLYDTALSDTMWIGVSAVIFYIVAGAVRLARYNVEEFDGTFYGLPITAAGVLLTLSYFAAPYIIAPYFVIYMCVLAWLMVSHIRIAKV